MGRINALLKSEMERVSGGADPLVRAIEFTRPGGNTITLFFCSDRDFNVVFNGSQYAGGTSDVRNYDCVPVGTAGSYSMRYLLDGPDFDTVRGGTLDLSDRDYAYEFFGQMEFMASIASTLLDPPTNLGYAYRGTGDLPQLSIYSGSLAKPPGEVEVLQRGDGGYVATAGVGHAVAYNGSGDPRLYSSYTSTPSPVSAGSNCVFYNVASNTVMNGQCTITDSVPSSETHTTEIEGIRESESKGMAPFLPYQATTSINGQSGDFLTDWSTVLAALDPLAVAIGPYTPGIYSFSGGQSSAPPGTQLSPVTGQPVPLPTIPGFDNSPGARGGPMYAGYYYAAPGASGPSYSLRAGDMGIDYYYSAGGSTWHHSLGGDWQSVAGIEWGESPGDPGYADYICETVCAYFWDPYYLIEAQAAEEAALLDLLTRAESGVEMADDEVDRLASYLLSVAWSTTTSSAHLIDLSSPPPVNNVAPVPTPTPTEPPPSDPPPPIPSDEGGGCSGGYNGWCP